MGQITYKAAVPDNGSNSFWTRSDEDSFSSFDDLDAPEGWYWLKWTKKRTLTPFRWHGVRTERS